MNRNEIKQKVSFAAQNVLEKKSFVSPIDVLMDMKLLTIRDYESWRFGGVPFLEKACQCNLHKLSLVMKELRSYARQNNLKPSLTYYKRWGPKGKKIQLRFSKSGDPSIEKSYSTHWTVSAVGQLGTGTKCPTEMPTVLGNMEQL